MCGAKGLRQLFLFEKGLIIAKRRDDGGMLVKTYIVVSIHGTTKNISAIVTVAFSIHYYYCLFMFILLRHS